MQNLFLKGFTNKNQAKYRKIENKSGYNRLFKHIFLHLWAKVDNFVHDFACESG